MTAADLVTLMATGNISTGAIQTATTGQVYVADGSMFATGGGGGNGDFNPAIVLALAPVATSGSISLGGVTTGQFRLAAGNALTVGDIAANGAVTLSAGGDLTTGAVNGSTVGMSSGGSVNSGNIHSGSTVNLVAGADVTVHDVSAATSASFTAGGLAEFLGIVSAPTINVASGDINIAAGREPRPERRHAGH